MTIATDQLRDKFKRQLMAQIRSEDVYGAWDKVKNEDLITDQFLDKNAQSNPESCSIINESTKKKVRHFHMAIASLLENLTGELTYAMVDLNHEGFGRGIVVQGRTVLTEKVYRTGKDLLYVNLDDAIDEAVKLMGPVLIELEI